MSIHPSLKIDVAGAQQRTVLTRIERIKDLMKKGKWTEGQQVFGLPKTKIIKVKARKSKGTKEAVPGAEGAAAPAAGGAAPAAPAAKAAGKAAQAPAGKAPAGKAKA